MKTFFLRVVCLLLMSVIAAVAGEGETLPPPEPNLPWEHADTGLRLPAELAKMTAEQVFHYEKAALGWSVRYSDRKARLRGDVYVYPCEKKAQTSEEIKEALRETAGSAVWEVEEMQRRGHYMKVKMGDAEYQPFDLIPESAGASALLSLPMAYTIVESDDAGRNETAVASFLGIMMLKNHFVKVRLTYPANGPDKEQDKVVERVSDFVEEVRRCVLDPGLRVQTADQIKTYRSDPLSKKGHDLAGGILAYAEVTPLIALTIDDTISTLGEDLEKEYPQASVELVRAFIVGAVAESLKKPGAEPADLPQAGAAEVVRVFGAMQKTKPGLESPRLVELEAAVKAKKAAAWLQQQQAKREK
ncbi:hypothetical protein [Prosthecobacter sp.]|uniref:hypothetical protein n=1 Tax=Prosthecobacter sp. TaxID=1965333 RepID=UPI0037847EB2